MTEADSGPGTLGTYARHGFAPLPRLIEPDHAAFLCRYVDTLSTSGVLAVEHGRGKVEGSETRYGDPLFDTLLADLAVVVSEHIGVEVVPTYSFVRRYRRGQQLEPHTDRPACQHSVSVHLGSDGGSRWQLRVIGLGGERVAVDMGPGDALAYLGMECPHWRQPLEAAWSTHVFLHYVDPSGPYAAHRLDGRPALGLPRDPASPGPG